MPSRSLHAWLVKCQPAGEILVIHTLNNCAPDAGGHVASINHVKNGQLRLCWSAQPRLCRNIRQAAHAWCSLVMPETGWGSTAAPFVAVAHAIHNVNHRALHLVSQQPHLSVRYVCVSF